MPYYNAEKTIGQTLDSILAQTFTDWELIAVNDQSTDDSEKVVRQKIPADKLVTLYTTTKGIVSALNMGIDKAQGDYIARIDADDLMMPDRLQEQVKVFKTYSDVNLTATDAEIINEHGDTLKSYLVSTNDLGKLNERCCIVHPSVMWRRSYFEEHQLRYNPAYEYVEDYELWLRYRDTPAPKYARISRPLIKYRVSPKSISTTKKQEQKAKNKKLYAQFNIPPYLSIMNLNPDKPADKFALEIGLQDYDNYEIISDLKAARGKYVAFCKFDNSKARFNQQVQFLDNSNYVGCGSYIQKKENAFFYTADANVIEREILKGHDPIEIGTFMCRNIQPLLTTDEFQLYANLMTVGKLTNVEQPLVKNDNYEGKKSVHIVDRMAYAREQYKDVINVVQLNITSDGNFSGVDRYLKTLEEGLPPNIRTTRITFIASDRIEWRLNQSHAIIYYNPRYTKLESMMEMFWDNLSQFFMRPNLIVQSNCLNLYTLIGFIRQKVRLTHVCMMHCVPYREVIRYDRNKYAELEAAFKDTDKDFVDTVEHYMPLALADHVILNTHDAEQYYIRAGHFTPYSVIYNGVEKIQRSPRLHEPPFRFIFVGHSSPLKGIDQLLQIIETVAQTHKFEVWWAGSADENLKRIIATKKLPIKVFGVIPPQQLNELYGQVDGALIATACETCSYAAIEALSAELPIIATKAHGVEELVTNVGLLVDMDDHAIINQDMYAEAMRRVIDEPDLRAKMSERAKAKYEDVSNTKMIAATAELYTRTVRRL
jgi:glycosyltransferase involved in cell wall biosynthesis